MKTNFIKKTFLSVAAASMMATSSFALFGVGDVVFDPTAVEQAIAQIKIMEDQLNFIKESKKAATGIRDSVKFYKDIKQLTDIMHEYKVSLNDLDIDNPKSKIGQMAQQIFKRNQIFDNCNVNYLSDLQKQTCKNDQIRNVSEIASAIVFSEELEKTSTRLQELSKKLSATKDLKESQDIGNAINLELANLQLTKTQMEMMKKANDAKSKADRDRLAQERAETSGTTSDLSGIFDH